jgi:hypothetical protein
VTEQLKGIATGIGYRGTVWLAVTMLVLTLAATFAPLASPGASAAECPPGQKMNSMGVCISIVLNPNIDVFDIEEKPQIDPGTVEHLDDLILGQGDGDVYIPDDDVIPGASGNDGTVNIPIEGPIFDPPQAGSASVSITKRNCPQGFDAYNADVYALAYQCQRVPGASGFLMSDGAGAVDSDTTDANGNVEFDGLAPGAYAILAQGLTKQFGDPVVMCESYTPQNPTGQPFEASVDLGNQFLDVLEDQEHLSCTWYNVPVA